jgi:hypothetical protein
MRLPALRSAHLRRKERRHPSHLPRGTHTNLCCRSRRVAKAIAWLRANYAQTLRIESPAELQTWGVSTLHHHFRVLPCISPLQYRYPDLRAFRSSIPPHRYLDLYFETPCNVSCKTQARTDPLLPVGVSHPLQHSSGLPIIRGRTCGRNDSRASARQD